MKKLHPFAASAHVRAEAMKHLSFSARCFLRRWKEQHEKWLQLTQSRPTAVRWK